MDGSKTSLGFLVLLSMVLFSGTSSGECGDDPARGVAGEREEVGWVMSREGDGGGVRRVSRNFLQGGAAAPTSFPSLAHLVLGVSSRLLAGSPGQNKGDLDEVVMPGIWAVTLGEEGAGTRQEIGLKLPLGSGSRGAGPFGTSRPSCGEETQTRPEKHTLPPRPVQQRPFYSLHLPALEGPVLFPGRKL